MKAPIIGISVLLVLAALAMPIKHDAARSGSASPRGPRTGNVHYYYEVEPFGVFIVESVFGSDLPLVIPPPGRRS